MEDLFIHNWPFIAAAAIALMMLGCANVARIAWLDAIKLDQEERGNMERLLMPLSQRLAPRQDIQIRQLRLRLQQAGLRTDGAIAKYTFMRAAALVAGIGLALLSTLFAFSFLMHLVTIIFFLGAAWELPQSWLRNTSEARQARISRALPATVDLMVLCLEVGLGVEAAFQKVTFEMRSMEPLMAEEAQLMVNEMSAGVIFPQALSRMADRIGLEELVSLAKIISQAASLGASVTNALREYSEASFNRRTQALEEHAGKINAYLVLPLCICLLPTCLLALLGPSIVTIVKTLL